MWWFLDCVELQDNIAYESFFLSSVQEIFWSFAAEDIEINPSSSPQKKSMLKKNHDFSCL